MRVSERTTGDLNTSSEPGAPMDWRRVLLGWGFLVLIAAAFVGGATKAGMAAKVIAAVGLLMIVVPVVALAVNWFQSKAKAHAGSRF